MKIADMRIAVRLTLGFGIVMLFMAALLFIGSKGINDIGQITSRVVETDWTKAEAAHSVNALTRANARRTMELFIVEDKDRINEIHQSIESNKKLITEALTTLERTVDTAEGSRLIAQIKETRVTYVTSFTKVAQLLRDGKRPEAILVMRDETLPALDVLQKHVNSLTELQGQLARASGADAKDRVAATYRLMMIMGVFALIAGTLLAAWVTRSITQPLSNAVEIAQRVAAGDLSSCIVVRGEDEMGQLLGALKGMNESLVKIVSQVRSGTENVATASTQIATGNADLASRTEAQAGALEETASSMQELTATVKNNSEGANVANELASTAREAAIRGGEVMTEVVNTMCAINQSARKMEEIISVIDNIAFQTNLLSLNAAVEAARAGEQGRGFAVVASEVRNLARRSAMAAKEIKELISDSAQKVDAGTELVSRAGTTMDEIVTSIKQVTEIMNDIAVAGHEQAAGLEQITRAISHMDDVTQQNAALVEESAAAAQALRDQARSLADVVRVFRLEEAGPANDTSISIAGLEGKRLPTRPVQVAGRNPVMLDYPARLTRVIVSADAG